MTCIPGWPENLKDLTARGLWKTDDPETQAPLAHEGQTLFDRQYAVDEAPACKPFVTAA